MKILSTRNLMMCLMVAITASLLAGCAIPLPIDPQILKLASNIEIPARPQTPDDIREIPEEFQQYVDNWEDFVDVEDFLNTPFEFEKSEEFCNLPDLSKIQEEAKEVVPAFLARRIRVRSVIVRAIRFTATAGNFNSVVDLRDTLSAGNKDYEFTIAEGANQETILELTSTEPVDLASVVNDPNIKCIANKLGIVGTLPEEQTIFDVELLLDIKIVLRII